MKHSISRIPVITLASGAELALTIHLYEGGPGPVVGVSAAIHPGAYMYMIGNDATAEVLPAGQ